MVRTAIQVHRKPGPGLGGGLMHFFKEWLNVEFALQL